MTNLAKRNPNTGLKYLDKFIGDLFHDSYDSLDPFGLFSQDREYELKIQKNEKDTTVLLALPGADKNDIKVDAHKGLLNISYQSTSSTKNTFCSRSYSQSWTLPQGTKEEQVTAEYVDGVLKVTIPKPESSPEDPPRKIEIK